MEDIVNSKNRDKLITQTAELIFEHNAENVTAIYIAEENSWTDYFIIATVNSQVHMKGVLKGLKTNLEELGIQFSNKIKKVDSFSWTIIDCGFFIIHLMDEEAREFYELEKLWFKGREVYSSKS